MQRVYLRHLLNIRTDQFTLDNGKQDLEMVKVEWNGLMELLMKVIGS